LRVNDNIIEVNHISFRYQPEESAEWQWVLRDFSMQLRRGTFTVILGHNASGKSTLAKLFNGLYKPETGEVLVNGVSTADEAREIEVRRTVGLVFQNPDNQMVATIVEEDVAFGPENLGIPPADIRERVDEALKAVDMFEYRGHAPHKLSGGQKQRVAIAGIIAMRPECIVLDEPTAMLDPRGRQEVMETLRRLNKEKNITVVLITHHMDEAVTADRVIVMERGAVIADGAPRQVFAQTELLKQARLDVPDPAELAFRLRKAGVNLPEGLLTVEETAQAIAAAVNGCRAMTDF
jgi:energy-coupling factor transport system ATP-binding protein